MVLAQAQLPGRADHPARLDALHLAPADLEVARQHRAHTREGHHVALLEVPRAADDLHRLAVAGVDQHLADLVRVRDGLDAHDPGHDDVAEPLAHARHPLDDHAQVVEGLGQRVDVVAERREVA